MRAESSSEKTWQVISHRVKQQMLHTRTVCSESKYVSNEQKERSHKERREVAEGKRKKIRGVKME